jgi:thiol-disulfide isomerase/thioredoxin
VLRLVCAVALSLLTARLAGAGGITVGDRLPAFTVTAWDGTRLESTTLAGKPVVVDFWASWCAPCRAALPALDQMARRLRARGVIVLAVNIDRDRAAADAWLAERLPDHAVTLAQDPEGVFLARCGASGMPTVYVVDRDGVVRFAASGYAPERVADVERAAGALVAPAAEAKGPS